MNKTSCYCCVFPALSFVKKILIFSSGTVFRIASFQERNLKCFFPIANEISLQKNWSINKQEIMKYKRPRRKLRYKCIFVTAYLCSFTQVGGIYLDHMLTRVIVYWYRLLFCSSVVNWRYRHFKSHSCQILLVCWLIYIIETRNNKVWN